MLMWMNPKLQEGLPTPNSLATALPLKFSVQDKERKSDMKKSSGKTTAMVRHLHGKTTRTNRKCLTSL